MTRRFLLLGFALLCVSGLGWSQQKGQWVHEQYGLNAGVVPDPGFTYQNLAINLFREPTPDAVPTCSSARMAS